MVIKWKMHEQMLYHKSLTEHQLRGDVQTIKSLAKQFQKTSLFFWGS